MKKGFVSKIVSLILLCSFASPCASLAEEAAKKTEEVKEKVIPLTEDEQKKLLNERLDTGAMIGPFGSFISFLYASQEYWKLMSHNQDVYKSHLSDLHVRWYKPTRGEFFDAIARQTGTTCKYDPQVDRWVFDPPDTPLPYTLEMASGWKSRTRGIYVGYYPEIQPVGMDVYMMGKYSGLSNEEQDKLIDEAGMMFAAKMKPGTTPKDFTETTVDGAKAKYFEVMSTSRGKQWRQWSFIKNGQCFIIVSAMDPENEIKLLPEVKQMVTSFRAK